MRRPRRSAPLCRPEVGVPSRPRASSRVAMRRPREIAAAHAASRGLRGVYATRGAARRWRCPERVRPGVPIHLRGVRTPLPGRGGAALHGFDRGLLRQRDGRVLLRHPRVRAARPNPLPEPEGGRRGGLRVHRGLVQPSPATLRPRYLSRLRSGGRREPALPLVRQTGARPSPRFFTTSGPRASCYATRGAARRCA